jgi:single-strand DNA-binding protein
MTQERKRKEMNKVLVTGNLVRPIDKRMTESGRVIVNNTIAVNRQYKDKDGERGVDFIPFTAFGQSADYLDHYAVKGDKREIVGRWQNRQYTDKNNQKRQVSELIVEYVSLLTPKKDRAETAEQAKEEPKAEAPIDDDLPF